MDQVNEKDEKTLRSIIPMICRTVSIIGMGIILTGLGITNELGGFAECIMF